MLTNSTSGGWGVFTLEGISRFGARDIIPKATNEMDKKVEHNIQKVTDPNQQARESFLKSLLYFPVPFALGTRGAERYIHGSENQQAAVAPSKSQATSTIGYCFATGDP